KREEQEAKRREQEKIRSFQLQPRQSLQEMRLSPDGKYVIALITENTEGSKTAIVPNFITESAYTEELQTRTKVGDAQPLFRLAVLSTENGEVAWLDHGQKESTPQSSEIASANPSQLGEMRKEQQGLRAREVVLSMPVWSEDGTRAALFAESADNKDRWILSLD